MGANLLFQSLRKRKKTIAFAESCSGGRLACAMTEIPGVSEVFLGSIVAYHNSVKERVLGVSKEMLSTCGAVSREVVTQMVEGVLETLGSDYACAISGIAGPSGGSEDKPVGTVWVAMGEKGKGVISGQFQLVGGRLSILNSATKLSLEYLYKFVENQINPFEG